MEQARGRNLTFMAADWVVLVDRHGRDVLVAIAKMAYAVSARGAVEATPQPPAIRATDVLVASDRPASIRYPSDLVDERPGTDVVLVATATPPAAEATHVDVSLRVGGVLGKTLRVFGTRIWYRGALGVVPGPPSILQPTPLQYELAYGGARQPAVDGGDPHPENPVGRGASADRGSLLGQPAPAIEDPSRPLGSRCPGVAGFAAIHRHWEPRARWAGTHDAAWQRGRAPLRPLDFDPRANCCSAPGLWAERPLEGTEPIEVTGARAEGPWRFALPRYRPRFTCVTDHGRTEVPSHLDTLLVDADRGVIELSWRVSVPLPRKQERIRAIDIASNDALPGPVLAPLL
jgi:hypothetical protein